MVIQTVEAVYDGKVLRPKKKLEIRPNTSVMVTVKPITYFLQAGFVTLMRG